MAKLYEREFGAITTNAPKVQEEKPAPQPVQATKEKPKEDAKRANKYLEEDQDFIDDIPMISDAVAGKDNDWKDDFKKSSDIFDTSKDKIKNA